MVQIVSTPTPIRPIVEIDGSTTQEMRSWIQSITNQSLIVGTGSPETVIPAEQGRRYMDDSGTTGTLIYYKRDPDIGGDVKKGWVLV